MEAAGWADAAGAAGTAALQVRVVLRAFGLEHSNAVRKALGKVAKLDEQREGLCVSVSCSRPQVREEGVDVVPHAENLLREWKDEWDAGKPRLSGH